MQLDTAVTYSGLPQDEWDHAKRPKKTSNGPVTPQAATKNASNKACKHTTTFMTLVVIFGFSVAFLIPLLISNYDVASLQQNTTTPLSNKVPSTIDKGENKNLPTSKGKDSTSKPNKEVTSRPSIKDSTREVKATKSVTYSKTKTTTSPYKKTGGFKSTLVTSKVRTIANTKSVQKITTKVPHSTPPVHYSSPTSSSKTTFEVHEKPSKERSNSSSIISKIIDVIYQNGNGTSGSGSDKDLEIRIKELLKSDPSIEIIIFGTAAVFMGLLFLLVGMSCIHQRRKAKNRRVKFQDVVTDLQSPDKVVLLTSDLSEEE